MLMLSVLLVLGGCVKYNAAFNISADDKVDVSLLLAIQQQYASLVREACTPSGNKNLPAGTITPYTADGYVGCTLKSSGLELSKDFKDNSPYLITHEGGEYTFWWNTKTGASTGTSTGTDSSTITSAMFTSFKVAVTFPGEVTSHSGSSTVEGTTVIWTNPDDAFTGDGLKATSKGASPLLPELPWGVGLAGLLIVVVVGLAVWSRSRRRRSLLDQAWAAMLAGDQATDLATNSTVESEREPRLGAVQPTTLVAPSAPSLTDQSPS
jgi:hypothetical protein